MSKNTIIEELKNAIEEKRKEKPNDYNDGIIDGLLIALRTIED